MTCLKRESIGLAWIPSFSFTGKSDHASVCLLALLLTCLLHDFIETGSNVKDRI